MIIPHSGMPERSVVDRALSVLGAFDRQNRTLTLSDISRRSGLPLATAHRIVNKLRSWGALERSEDGGYSIGLRLWETGTLAPRCSPLAEAAQPYLMELHARTSAGAFLLIRDRVEGVCLSFVVHGPDSLMSWIESGDRRPLHACAAGLVLLAYASEAVQNEVCAGPLRAYTPATPVHGAALRQALAKVRREGYAVTHRTLDPDSSSVAFPVRSADGAVMAAVGVVAQADTFHPAKLLPPVSTTADAVSQHMRSCG
ncbi:IclR family transcriptional regulator [Streptomyces capitiformicae]|uniref:Glycerol operon regulatory protein n=1 Tax=Streptomyces capitiformicae TaxID=2014920 RepID=A0A919DHC0_9ACTN|nr:IclR family transcriptional regulator [Streptomyces capitiformicae]GHE44463.1 IclR family transcriptional regulator [Streptomyces capitiformicae]